MKGISGSQNEGADSIVASGGYEDDHDFGDIIIYTGEGGRDPNTGTHVADQEFRGGNRALAVSCDEGLPVRVIRGARGDPALRRRRVFATTASSTSSALARDRHLRVPRAHPYGRERLLPRSEPDWRPVQTLCGDTSEP